MIAAVGVGLLLLGLLAVLAAVLVGEARELWRAVAALRRRRQWRAAARLTAAEAVALAAAVIAEPFFRDVLAASLDERDGALVWQVSSMTIDMGVTALVDDATGAVSEVHHWSGWSRR